MANSKNLKIKVKSYYNYIQIFNGYINLTHQEIRVLAEFCKLYKKYFNSEDDFKPNVFSREMKAQVAKNLGYSSPDSLNNYVKAFKDKGAIKPFNKEDKSKGYYIISLLIPGNENQIVINLEKPEKSEMR
jgi:hypothetical protein